MATMREAQEAVQLVNQASANDGACWYVLQRHGGRRNCVWRWFGGGPFSWVDRAGAKARAAMRQGGLRLIGPDGTIIWSTSAPRLRSRW